MTGHVRERQKRAPGVGGGGLLKLIASSLCREHKQKAYRVCSSRVTLFLPDFIPDTNQWIDYGLDMRADCKYGGYWTLLLTCWIVFWHNVSPCPLFAFCSGPSDKTLLQEGPFVTCLVYWLLLSPFCAITGWYWLPAGLDYIQNVSLL